MGAKARGLSCIFAFSWPAFLLACHVQLGLPTHLPDCPTHLPQLGMMAGIFPRHVIEYFSTHQAAVPERMGQLARSHEGVTILFMDIVGFTSMAKEVEPRGVMT